MYFPVLLSQPSAIALHGEGLKKNLTNQVRTSDLEIIQLQSHALPTELW